MPSSRTIRNVHFSPSTDNRKTGPIPVTTRPMNTCPTDCPFLPTNTEGGGCYGTGILFGQASQLASDTTVEQATAKLDRRMWRGARYLRDRVLGDVLNTRGRLDRGYITSVSQVARNVDVVPFGYTHAWRNFTGDDVAFMRDQGYVMNASTETLDDVEQAVGLGLDVAIVNDDLPDGTMIAGKRLVTCPNVTHPGVTCASCGLCAKPDRLALVRFFTHGSVGVRRRAQRTIASRNTKIAAPAA